MAHYERMGIEAESVEKGVDYGIYHTKFKIQGEPLVSVVIPNKDHWQELGHLRAVAFGAGHIQEPGVDRGGEQQHAAGDFFVL